MPSPQTTFSQATKNRARITPQHGFLLNAILLVDAVGQRFGWNELNNFLGSDFDGCASRRVAAGTGRSDAHTSELQSLMRISYAVFCLKKKKTSSTIDLIASVWLSKNTTFCDQQTTLVLT